ncbi:alpha/beta fold hydrolase [Leifsonia soli]|uniref:Pimeloyl-ACP methyl ester carboxylesterase n=1 Tax=Leifsonia soli TaxID=582665 RepID=A0A852T026_9MICO|nr:alpha/beta hydrolase [Leifsonia soli]NYD74497.1 pimeloyl-ACP methyl ester carboxylesterase [Leifsonia soli]
MNTSTDSQVHFLQRPDGRVSYTVEGSGPLVVAVPGMGDLRSSYRELVGPLVAAGYRVAVTDLRAHGDSDTTFTEFGDIATGRDVIALIEELGGPAVVLGNSMGAAAAAWAAAERPDLVAGLVFYGPLLRDPAMGRAATGLLHLLYRAMFVKPWGAATWAGYYGGTLNRGRKAPWLAEHTARIRASLSEPGRLRSFRRLTLALTHSVVEPRLADVRAPMLAFVGDLDPDFRDLPAECAWMESIGAEVVRVPDAAHYPHAQRPDLTVPTTLAFIASRRDGDGSAWAARA